MTGKGLVEKCPKMGLGSKVPFSISGAGSGLDGRNGNSRLLVGLYGGAQRLAGAGFGKRWKGQGIE